MEIRTSIRKRLPGKYFYPDLKNAGLAAILLRFDRKGFSPSDSRRRRFRLLWPLFEASLGDMAAAVRSEEDFSAATFLRQAEFIRDLGGSAAGDDVDLLCRVIPRFYRYVQEAVGHPIFTDGAAVTTLLLSCTQLSRFLRGCALFTVWSPGMVYVPGHDYYVVTLYGFDRVSTCMKTVDYVTLDLSVLPEPLRPQVFRYILSTPHRVVSQHSYPMVRTLYRLMEEYFAMKGEPGYPNPAPRVMTTSEMDHMRSVIIGAYGVAETGNAFLRLFRDFVSWAIGEGLVSGSSSHLRALHNAREKGKGRQETVPDADMVRLVARMRELAAKDGEHACCYAALRILAVTKLRVSAVCSLRTDCLVQTADHGVWQVVSTSKTSGRGRDRFTVSEAEHRAIEAVLAATAPLRAHLAEHPYRDALFVYRSRCGIRTLDAATLRRVMRLACDDLGIPHYQPHHVRASRQTRAARYAEKVGLNKQDTAVLTGHKSRDTTMNYYVSVSPTDYYAALYGVMTEDVQTAVAGTVAEEMPSGAEPAAGDAARLGACASDVVCTARTLLPCLTCRYFVTDVHHLRLFEQAIEDIDRRIMEATVPHDKEDLVTMKEIYVVYIQKIKEKLCERELKR